MVVSAVDNDGNSKPIRCRCEEQPLQMCASVIYELKMVETKQQTTKAGTIKQPFFLRADIFVTIGHRNLALEQISLFYTRTYM